MHRLLRLSLLMILLCIISFTEGYAQIKSQVYVSGRLAPGDVRVFLKDSVYIIDKEYVIGGTLLIEPGTEVYFYTDGVIIDSVGGRIIADGFARAEYHANPTIPAADNPYSSSDELLYPDFPLSKNNPFDYEDYADLDYFLYNTSYLINDNTKDRTIKLLTEREATVNKAKYHHIFHVVLNKSERALENLQNPLDAIWDATDGLYYVDNGTGNPDKNRVIIPFEQALMFIAARMDADPDNDINLRRYPWARVESYLGTSVNIGTGNADNDKIKFYGQAKNNQSREWGHIVVLPGARAAFFRNCSFENFKKDTTVGRHPFYDINQGDANWAYINNKLRLLTNGTGGAITSLSSRLWLVNCEFTNNSARHKGGALALLQTPYIDPVTGNNFPMDNNGTKYFDPYDLSMLGRYIVDKNPNIVDKDGQPSSINKIRVDDDGFGKPLTDANGHPVIAADNDPTFIWLSRIPAIDLIDEDDPEPIFNFDNDETKADYYRQAFDDGRLSLYLGRIRNLKFENNKVQLAKVGVKMIPGTPPTYIVDDYTDLEGPYAVPADYGREYGDVAFGGAVYIAGDPNDPNIKEIEVGFGVNHSIKINGGATTIEFDWDTFEAIGNKARNFQNQKSTSTIQGSLGARGGAIYVGSNTSLIVAGKFASNLAEAPWLLTEQSVANDGFYASGGAIYAEKTRGRLQVVGGPERDTEFDNPTIFENNQAGTGGAIFVTYNLDNSDNYMSPIVGGSNTTINTRNYGYNIIFKDNIAYSFGGAIFSNRNFTIYGAGGVESNSLIGYGGKYPVIFENNQAGFSGGAITIKLPISSDLVESDRAVEVVRARFLNNKVGYSVYDDNNLKTQIRGGGAIYTINGSLSVVKGVEFNENMVKNGNGGAIAMVNPQSNTKRFFLTDVDIVNYNNGFAESYTSVDEVFTTALNENDPVINYPPDTRMLTRFIKNKTEWDEDYLMLQSGSGTTQVGAGATGTTENLNSIAYSDPSNGFAVGDNGTIIHLVNNGTKWIFQNGNTSMNLNKITFITGNIGFIVGKNEVILKTTDGGDTWVKVNEASPVTDLNIYDIEFTNTNIGYAVGENGLILKTVDGGSTWTQLMSGVANNLYGVDFTDLNYGYIVGERGLVLKTTDAGLNWSTKTSGTLQTLVDVYFTASQTGYAIGTSGTILKTYDGGNTWNALRSNTTLDLFSIFFADPNTAYVTALDGTVLKTTNSGELWNVIETGITNNNLYGSYFSTVNVGYAVGDAGTIIQTTNGGVDWEMVEQANKSEIDAKRFHPETTLPENGVGLGGALYILDLATADRARTRQDSIQFNRVRLQNNEAYTGAAIYSDNFDLKLIFNRSLVTNNKAYSEIGMNQNLIRGSYYIDDNSSTTFNWASHDLAGAIIYGEIQGPLPSSLGPWAGNSIYDNNARFLIRLPDAPNSKGVLAGNTGEGFGGTDTLRSNYWGRTEANVMMEVYNEHLQSQSFMETFFVDTDGKRRLDFVFWQSLADRNNLESSYGSLLFQGPFESISRYPYKAIPLLNKDNENTPDYEKSIPEKLLFSGRIYDLYDKGVDIKTADYTKRRMSPIEDFAVGIPPVIDRYAYDTTKPSYGKYVKRYVRDPFIADSVDEGGNWVYPKLHSLQDEFLPDENGTLYHPIGYPLFLEAMAKYETGLAERYNLDPLTLNETVFFIINETTGDFIRANLKQLSTTSPVFRARIELIPDSSDRNGNTLIRRTFEGLLNLGTDAPGGDPKLLKALKHNPYNEDRATLQGRKYENRNTHFGGTLTRRIEDLFINRDHWPVSNKKFGTDYATFFAGERYRALPVDTGDIVRIVSRTVLWREGVNQALEDGILLKITASTEPPVYTGDVYDVMNNVITQEEMAQYPWGYLDGRIDTVEIDEWRNTIFVTEDRMYPAPYLMYSATDPDVARLYHGTSTYNKYNERYGNPDLGYVHLGNAAGRDRILTVTARDNNKYYDPRSLYVPEKYSNLYFDFEVDPNSGLARWLFKEHIPAGKSVDNEKWGFTNPGPDSVYGFMIMRGRPINPFVVPGGETLTLRVHNFPPHYRTIDSLLTLEDDEMPAQDTIDKWMEIFTSYLHAPKYDVVNARYLQQDTIDLGKMYYREYECKVYVVDSIPIFLNPDDPQWSDTMDVFVEQNLDGDEEIIGQYVPSVYPCRQARDGRLLANLTNKLRFQVDFNTNDELEDSWVENNWDFRFGRTAYGFQSRNIRLNDNSGRGGEEVIIDTVLETTRPVWMSNDYIYVYDSDTTGDEFAADFTTYGKLNVRIDSAMAIDLLTPTIQFNDALNLDTLFTVIVNDGHGGINSLELPVMINVEPKILTETLPPAKEDIDYNPELRDTTKMIQIFDPNFYQDHTFALAYDDEALNQLGLSELALPDSIRRDPCFSEAGWHYLRQYDEEGNLIYDLKTTPTWLRINKETGLLYGTPGVKDAPRNEKVTVIVFDEDSLAAIKVFDLRVDSTNHCSGITAAPAARCIDQGGKYEDIIYVYDRDLMRGRVEGDPTEDITITVLEPTGLKIEVMGDDGNWSEDNHIKGIRNNDTAKVRISTDNFTGAPDQDGRVTIKVVVKDAYGCLDTLIYKVKYSMATDFVADIVIRNNKGAENTLQFGTAPFATSGYGLDGEELGHLDSNYCEYELPPIPHQDIFDVRWTIPNSNGIYRNIFMTGSADKPGEKRIYRGRLQSGGEAGNTSNHYPLTLKWNTTQIPAVDDAEKNASAGSWIIRDAYSSGNVFHYDMHTGEGFSTSDVEFSKEGDMITLTIYSDVIDAFQILYNWNPVGVEEPVAGYTTGLASVTPNPMTSEANINFSTAYREQIKIEVVDELGKVVKVLTDDSYAPGNYQIRWNGKDVYGNDCPNGSYTVRMVAGTVVTSTPVVIVK